MTDLNWNRPRLQPVLYATSAQRAYIRRLLRSKDLNGAQKKAYWREANNELTRDRASELIDILLTHTTRARP